MKIEIEVSDKDVLEFGREAIEKEIRSSLQYMKLRTSFAKLSDEIRETWDETEYSEEMELVRQDAWEIYRKKIGL